MLFFILARCFRSALAFLDTPSFIYATTLYAGPCFGQDHRIQPISQNRSWDSFGKVPITICAMIGVWDISSTTHDSPMYMLWGLRVCIPYIDRVRERLIYWSATDKRRLNISDASLLIVSVSHTSANPSRIRRSSVAMLQTYIWTRTWWTVWYRLRPFGVVIVTRSISELR